MIQVDTTEKAPPSYTPMSYAPSPGDAYNGQPTLYPPPQQPQMSPGITLQYPAPLPTEAAIGSQYQQQLFARCARGEHDVEKKYGPCGIITSVIFFPIGLFALLFDVEKKCARCGVRIP